MSQQLDSGAEVHPKVKGVDGGKLVAAFKDAHGNITGLVQSSSCRNSSPVMSGMNFF